MDHPQLPPSHSRPAAHDDTDDDFSTTASTSGDAVHKLPYSRCRCIALVATVTGASVLNAVVILLPSIGRDLDVPDARLQWIVSAYALTFGCCLLLWGRIADVFGKKPLFVAGAAWLTLATVANPFVPGERAFDVLRGLQGVGAAATVPTAVGILGTTFAPGRAQNYAFAAYGAGAPLGSVLGTVLAGGVASLAGWRWVFGVLALLSGLLTVAGFVVLPAEDASPAAVSFAAAARTVDWLGAVAVTLGLVGLLFALTEGNAVGWATPWVGALLGLSLLLLTAFGLWQHWLAHARRRSAGTTTSTTTSTITGTAAPSWPPPPLLRLAIFAGPPGRRFAAALLFMALFCGAFNGFLVYATYLYQTYQGLAPLPTTLRFLPTGVGGLLTCAAVARLLHRVPTAALLLLASLAVAAASLLLVALPVLDPDRTPYAACGLWAMLLSVVGADTAWPALTLWVARALPPADQALGGALVNMAAQLGRALGLALATAIQTAAMAGAGAGPARAHDPATLHGLRAASWFHVGLGLCCALLAAVAFRGAGTAGNAETPAPPPAADEEKAAPQLGA